jgi:small-conductance mechanosensitive channel
MSVFGEAIDFLVKLGVYDIILPFLLVFTIIFAMLEKTKILGHEKGKDDKEYTKKNLNAMVAFVAGFFVVASAQLVAIINKTLSQVFILLLIIVCFLMLAGAFHAQSKDGFFLNKKDHPFYYNAFMVIVFVSIIMIFLNAAGWLDVVFEFLTRNWNTSYVAAVIFVLVMAGIIWWITKDQATDTAAKKD